MNLLKIYRENLKNTVKRKFFDKSSIKIEKTMFVAYIFERRFINLVTSLLYDTWAKFQKYREEYLKQRSMFYSSAIAGVFTGLVIAIFFEFIRITESEKWINLMSYDVFPFIIYLFIAYVLLYLLYVIGKLLVYILISKEKEQLLEFKINYFAGMYSTTLVTGLILLKGKMWITLVIFSLFTYIPLEYFAVVEVKESEIFLKLSMLLSKGVDKIWKIILSIGLYFFNIIKTVISAEKIRNLIRSCWNKIIETLYVVKQKKIRILIGLIIFFIGPIIFINLLIFNISHLSSDSLKGSVTTEKDSLGSEYYLPDMAAIKSSDAPIIDYIFEDILAFNTTFRKVCFYDNGTYIDYKDNRYSNSSYDFILNLTFYGDVNNKEDLNIVKRRIYPVNSDKGPSEECFSIPTVNFTMHWGGEYTKYVSNEGHEWPSIVRPNVGTRVIPDFSIVFFAYFILLLIFWSSFLIIVEIWRFIWGK